MSELVERASQGEEIVITHRGEQIARLMPPLAKDAAGQGKALAARIRCSRAGRPLGSDVLIRDLIDEGRR